MEELLELLLNSQLDASGLCICERDIERIADVVNRIDGANISKFIVDKKKDSNINGVYEYRENRIRYYVSGIRKTVQILLSRPGNQERIAKLTKEEYEILIKSIALFTILHEFDHVLQWRVMQENDTKNPDYLLLQLARGKFRPDDNPELDEFLRSKLGERTGRRMGRGDQFMADLLESDHDLIPYERMANFHAYEQLLATLNLSKEDNAKIIYMAKLLRLRPLLQYYTSKVAAKETDEYDGTHAPSAYFLGHTGGLVYYGEKFEQKLLKLYRKQPLAYRFYAGLTLEPQEVRLYENELRRASAGMRK